MGGAADLPRAFGALLKHYRAGAGWTQRQLATRAGLSPRTVQDLERGLAIPHRGTLTRLAAALALPGDERRALEAAARRRPRLGPGPSTSLRRNLPLELTSFVGREREQAEVARLLGTARLLTLTGPGGVGKTRLALRVAAAQAADYADGVWLADLASLADPALVPQAVAAVLGVTEQRGRRLLATLADALRARRVLLVLDNCEHLVEGCAALASELLRACPQVVLLATSREPLRVIGEASWPVASLSLPDPTATVSVEALRASEAVRLFLERARAVRPGFVLTEDNAPAVAEVCQWLAGLPLALELAAARLGGLPVTALLAGLRRVPGGLLLLTGGPRDAPPRQRSLRATIAWSFDLLSAAERTLFCRLGVFRGASLEAIETVCIAPSPGPGSTSLALPALRLDALAGVTSLVDKGLLRLEEDERGRPRYSMLEPLRDFALERLEASGEAPAVRRRQALWCLRLVEDIHGRSSRWPGLPSAEDRALLDQLAREHANCRLALDWCLAQGYAEPGLRLGIGLWWFWFVRGHATEGRGRLAALLQRFPAHGLSGRHALLRARALEAAGRLAALQGDLVAARPLLEQALDAVEVLDETRAILSVLEGLALVAYQVGDYDAAGAYLDRSLTLARADGNPSRIGAALYNLGTLAHDRGDYARAQALLAESAALYEQLGETRSLGLVYLGLGTLDQARGNLEQAGGLAAQALALLERCGDQRGTALALANLGSAAIARRDVAAAHRHLAASLRGADTISDPAAVASALDGFAALAASQGQAIRALRLAGAADRLREDAQLPLLPSARRTREEHLASARRALGRMAEAAVAAGRALPQTAAISEALAPVPAARRTAGGAAGEGLSRRELEVARLIGRGYTNRAIAAELVIGEGTVATHVVHILAKLGFASRAQVAVWAATRGWME